METEQLRKLLLYMWCSEEESDEALKAAVHALLKKLHAEQLHEARSSAQ
jgi:hypothetical protein